MTDGLQVTAYHQWLTTNGLPMSDGLHLTAYNQWLAYE